MNLSLGMDTIQLVLLLAMASALKYHDKQRRRSLKGEEKAHLESE